MKDKKLLKIWTNKEKSYNDFWKYSKLKEKDKSRLFDLLSKQ